MELSLARSVSNHSRGFRNFNLFPNQNIQHDKTLVYEPITEAIFSQLKSEQKIPKVRGKAAFHIFTEKWNEIREAEGNKHGKQVHIMNWACDFEYLRYLPHLSVTNDMNTDYS